MRICGGRWIIVFIFGLIVDIPRDPEKMEKIAEDMREYRRSQEEMMKRQVCWICFYYLPHTISASVNVNDWVCYNNLKSFHRLVHRKRKRKQRI